MNRIIGVFATVVLLSIAVIACGGGGSSSGLGGGTVVAPTTVPVATVTAGTAQLSIVIPNATTSSSSTRRTAYISSATKSVAVFAYPSAATPPPTATTLVNVGASLPGCTAATTSGVTCTITVPAVYGSMTFTIKTYDNVLGTGNLLSQATITQAIGPSQAPIPVTLSGIIASTQLVLPQFSFPAGGGSFTLGVEAFDVNGALIAGGGTYSSPIYISSNDSADITVSPNPVTGPGQTVTVTYNASAVEDPALTANVAGLSQNVEGRAPFTISQPAATNLTAYAYDNNTNSIYAFPAGANSNTSLLARYAVPSTFVAPQILSVAPDGKVAFAPFGAATIDIYAANMSGSSSTLHVGGDVQGFAYDPSTGNLVVLVYSPSEMLKVYAPTASGTATPLFTYSGSQLAPANNGSNGIGIDGMGNVYVEESSNSAPTVPGSIVVFAPGSSTYTYLKTIPETNAPAHPFDPVAVAADGTVVIKVPVNNNTAVQLNIYRPDGSSAVLSGGLLASGNDGGTTFGPDDSLYYAAGNQVVVYAPNAQGTAPPIRSFLGTRAGAQSMQLIGLGPAPATVATPIATSVSGDMLNLAASRTWNYNGTTVSGAHVTVTVYADPQPVDGNTGLVAFALPTTAPNALPTNGGTLAAALGVANQSDGYHAVSFGSVSNDSFGLVPGAPLIVPSTLTYGAELIPYPGVEASVGLISAPSSSVLTACPSATQVASVNYYFDGTTSQLQFSPGCGIVRYTNFAGTTFNLISIESHPELGQQSVARHVLTVTYGDMLRTLWQKVFNGR